MLYTKFWPAMVALAVIIGCGYTAKGNGADSTGRALTADSVAHGAAAKSPVTTLTGGGGRPQSVGLVLSGGGAKGIAHVGFIQALEDNDIPIDYIAGTSMGAIVGGLYACGYTPDEMMDLLCSKGFAYWSTGKNDPDLMYYFARQHPSPAMGNISVKLNKELYTAADSVPWSLINALPMNFAFMDLFSAYTAQCGGDFDRLFVPFRCVASNVAANHKVVHRSGDVGDCIRSSMSFPLVFQPLKFGKNYLYDGGLFDNFPVNVMTADFAPDIMIGVNVGSSDKGPRTSMYDQINDIATRPQSYTVPDSLGMKVRINLDQFGLLDFPKAEEIYRIGYASGVEHADSIKKRVTSRIPKATREARRMAFKARTPFVHFDSVDVRGGSPNQNKYLRYIFEPAKADTFGIVQARHSFYRAVSSGRIQNLLPQAVYNDSTGLFRLNVWAAPKNDFNVGLGGYISSSTQSYIFLSAAYNTLSFNSIGASLNGWIGQSYMAGQINAAVNLHTAVPSAVGVTAVVSRQRYLESDRIFYDVSQPAFLIGHEYYGRLSYDWAAGAIGRFSLSAGFGHLFSSYFRLDERFNAAGGACRDHTTQDLGQLRLGYTSSTLDEENYPTQGHDYNFVLQGVLGRFKYRPGEETLQLRTDGPSAVPGSFNRNQKWLQLQSRTRNYWSLSRKFGLGLESDVLLSTRKLTDSYDADIVTAPSFEPTPAAYNQFNRHFRANSYLAATLAPIYKISSSFTARLTMSAFVPLRRIMPGGGTATEADDGTIVYSRPWGSHYSGWLNTARFYGEFDVCYSLPIPGVVTAYVNYVSSGTKPWGIGLSLGIFLHAPKFLQ